MKISCFCCEKFCCVWKTKTTWLSAKNSFINRCLFIYRWLMFFYIIYVSLVAFITTTRVCCVVVVVVVVTGTVFLLSSSVYMCFMDSHIVLYCTVFLSLLYDSALATIILKATWLELFPWESVADSCPCTVSHYVGARFAEASVTADWKRTTWKWRTNFRTWNCKTDCRTRKCRT